MDKRITASLWYYGSAVLFGGFLGFYRWGLFSLLGFYPADLCTPEVADRFFSKGGKINYIAAKKIEQDSDLLNCTFQNAVKHHSLSSLQLLINGGIDVNVADEKGMTGLFYAKSKQLAQLLIDNGADVEARNNLGKTPIFYAQSRKMAQLLIDNGADVEARSKSGETPLFEAKSSKVAQVLIDNGANVNARSKSGETPLSAIQSFLKSSQAQLQLYIFLPDNISYKTEQISYTKQSTVEAKELIEVLINHGGIK